VDLRAAEEDIFMKIVGNLNEIQTNARITVWRGYRLSYSGACFAKELWTTIKFYPTH
jgi:hypothetical protein